MNDSEFFERLADIAIRVGVNLQQGQELAVVGDVEHAQLVRATMEAGWRAGAADVQALYREPYDQLFLGRYAPDAQLQRSSFASLALLDNLANGQSAYVAIDRGAEFDLYREIDPSRFARIAPAEYRRRLGELGARRGVAWTVIPFPTPSWAAHVFGEPDVARLRDAIAHGMRLDESDPVAAWQSHGAKLEERAHWLSERRYDGIRFRGPQTDLFVGLLPTARWGGFRMETAWGQKYCPNIPTEEVATTPDWRRTHGVVTTTVPFADAGAYVAGATFTFENGRLLAASATEGEPWLLEMLATDQGASRLGELALVPTGNRLADLGRTYFHGLFDENVASHIAFGLSYTETVPGAEAMTDDEREAAGMAISNVHYDFMIGGTDIDVFGITKDGAEEAVMVAGQWHPIEM